MSAPAATASGVSPDNGTTVPGEKAGIHRLNRDALQKLIGVLREDGYLVVAPTRRDGAIVYDEINSIEELPAGWIDQFETSGCVGCGRCITWCPVGIDITEEVAAIRRDVSEEAASDLEESLHTD